MRSGGRKANHMKGYLEGTSVPLGGVPKDDRDRRWKSRKDLGNRPRQVPEPVPEPVAGPDFDDFGNQDLADCLAVMHREDPDVGDLAGLMERTLRTNSPDLSPSRRGKNDNENDGKRKASPVSLESEDERDDADGDRLAGTWTSEEEDDDGDAMNGIDASPAPRTDWDCPYPDDLDEKRYACAEPITPDQNFFFYLHLLEHRMYASERK